MGAANCRFLLALLVLAGRKGSLRFLAGTQLEGPRARQEGQAWAGNHRPAPTRGHTRVSLENQPTPSRRDPREVGALVARPHLGTLEPSGRPWLHAVAQRELLQPPGRTRDQRSPVGGTPVAPCAPGGRAEACPGQRPVLGLRGPTGPSTFQKVGWGGAVSRQPTTPPGPTCTPNEGHRGAAEGERGWGPVSLEIRSQAWSRHQHPV